MATTSPAVRFPGDLITERPTRPASETKTPALKLGPGLTHTPPATISAHTVGYLIPDHKKNALWLESDTRRVPSPALPHLPPSGADLDANSISPPRKTA